MHDVLALCHDFRAWGPGVRYAAELARLIGASLSALYVGASAPVRAPAGIPPSLLAEFVAYVQDDVQAAMRAGARFSDWARQFGIASPQWRVALGDTAEALAAAGGWSDLVVLERRGEGREDSTSLICGTLMSGAACLSVPEASYAIGRIERVAVVSDGSAASVRALHGALPLLKHALQVILIEMPRRDRGRAPVAWSPPISPAVWLSRRGIEVTVEALDTRIGAIGDALLETTSRSRVDLIVAGAEGKLRFDECMLDPVPRHLVRHAAVPLYLRN